MLRNIGPNACGSLDIASSSVEPRWIDDLDACQNRPECGALELLFEARERPDEIDARTQIRSKLPAELRELTGADPAEENSLPQGRPARRYLVPAGVTFERPGAARFRRRCSGALGIDRDGDTDGARPKGRIALIGAGRRSTFPFIRAEGVCASAWGPRVRPGRRTSSCSFRESSANAGRVRLERDSRNSERVRLKPDLHNQSMSG